MTFINAFIKQLILVKTVTVHVNSLNGSQVVELQNVNVFGEIVFYTKI